MKFKPKTNLGRFSIKFGILFLTLIFLSQIFGYLLGFEDIYFRTIFLPVLAIGSFLSGLTSSVIGIISILKHKEKSIFVYIFLFMGILIFLIGEFTFSH